MYLNITTYWSKILKAYPIYQEKLFFILISKWQSQTYKIYQLNDNFPKISGFGKFI